MVENKQRLSVREYFSAMHQLRSAARGILTGDIKALGSMLNEMDKLTSTVEFEGAEIFLKSVFEEMTQPWREQPAAVSVDDLKKLKVPAGTKLPVEKFVEVRKEIQAKEDELKKLDDGGAEKKTRALKEQEDSLEVQALKAEILGWIEKNLPTDAEKTKAKKQLEEADELHVSSGKGNKITVEFGNFSASFRVSSASLQIGTGLSTYGGLVQVYKPAECSNFIGQLLKTSSRGKKYVTAIGKTAANLKKQQDNKEKGRQDKKKKLEKEIILLEQKLQMSWRNMLQHTDAVTIYQDLRTPKGLLKAAGGTDKVKTDMQLVTGILASEKLWAFYQKKDSDNDSYNQDSDYTKLKKQGLEGLKMQIRLENAYQSYQVGGDKTLSVFLAQLKTAHQKNAEFNKLPFDAVEQYMLDEAFSFAVPAANGQPMDEGRFKFMNALMEKYGLRIRLTSHKITEKCEGRLNDDIHKAHNTVKKYKKQLTGLLYFMGKKLAKRQNTGDVLYDSELKKTFLGICKTRNISGDWERFVNHPDNVKTARETYDILNAEYGKKAEEIGKKLIEGGELKGNSLHHVTYAYYAPLMGSDAAKIVDVFNSSANTVEALPPVHPAFEDVHKDLEHRFNVGNGGNVLVERAGKIMLCTTNSSRVGDVLLMPVLERKGEDGKFSPVMRPDTVFITASGRGVKEPVFGGEGNCKLPWMMNSTEGYYL